MRIFSNNTVKYFDYVIYIECIVRIHHFFLLVFEWIKYHILFQRKAVHLNTNCEYGKLKEKQTVH